jgi:hypothetical protein
LVFCCVASLAGLTSCSGRTQSGPGLPTSLSPSSALVAGSATRKTFDAPPASAPAYTPQTFVGYQHTDDIFQHSDDVYQQPNSIEVVPQGQTPSANADGSQPVPLAGGIVTYPDGSTQVTDQSGAFVPANSSYVQENAATIESDPSSGISVTVEDAAGADQPLSMQLQAGQVEGKPGDGNGRQSQSIRAVTGNGRLPDIAAIVALPRTVEVRDGASVPLSIVALDKDGHATLLAGASITWTSPSAGSLVTHPDGSATYRAPATGSGIDRFAATILGSDGTPAFKAGVAVAYVGRERLSRVPVSLIGADGSSASPSTRLGFVRNASGESAGANSAQSMWFAERSPHGNLTVRLPSDGTFVPFALSTQGYSSVNAPGGTQPFSPAEDAERALFTLGTSPFSLPRPVAVEPSTAIRDADLLSAVPRERNLFDPASGLASLLATPFAPAAGTVASGTFAGWTFEWQGSSSAPTLVLLESLNGRGGTASATISPLGDGATFAFARYRSATALDLTRPLVAAQDGSLLTSDGAWSQSPAGAGVTASLQLNLYDLEHQTPGIPAFSERGTFLGAAVANAAYRSMSIYDDAGYELWTYDAERTVPDRSGSFAYVAQATRATPYSGGATMRHFQASGNGGTGVDSVVLRERESGASVSYDIAPTLSGFHVTDGIVSLGSAPVATFRIDASGHVRAEVGAQSPGGRVPLEFPL